MKRSRKDRLKEKQREINEKAHKKNDEENAKLLEISKNWHTKGEDALFSIDNISFMGEELGDFMVDPNRPKFGKVFLIKKHIKQIPRAFTLMPKVGDFKVKKFQTMYLLEIAKEWTKRNVARDKSVLEHRKMFDPDDDFTSHGFPEFAWKAMLNVATIIEADSFYDSAITDLAMTFISIHETCDINWSNHIMKCNRCNVNMIFANSTTDQAGIIWLSFVCPKCQASASYGKDMYLREVMAMIYAGELMGHQTYMMKMHFEKDHPGVLKDSELGKYPKCVKGCAACKGIDDERNRLHKQNTTLLNKYLTLFHELFQITNPFTGEAYAVKKKPESKE